MNDEQKTPRQHHLDWCKRRALAYLDTGDVQQCLASFASDIRKDESAIDIPRSPRAADSGRGVTMPLYGNHEWLTWVYEGQPVIARMGDKGQGCRGTVTKAAGHHAEFTSRDGKIVRWIAVSGLLPDDGRIDERDRKRKEEIEHGVHRS